MYSGPTVVEERSNRIAQFHHVPVNVSTSTIGVSVHLIVAVCEVNMDHRRRDLEIFRQRSKFFGVTPTIRPVSTIARRNQLPTFLRTSEASTSAQRCEQILGEYTDRPLTIRSSHRRAAEHSTRE